MNKCNALQGVSYWDVLENDRSLSLEGFEK